LRVSHETISSTEALAADVDLLTMHLKR